MATSVISHNCLFRRVPSGEGSGYRAPQAFVSNPASWWQPPEWAPPTWWPLIAGSKYVYAPLWAAVLWCLMTGTGLALTALFPCWE